MEVSLFCSHSQRCHSAGVLLVDTAAVPQQQHQDVGVSGLGRLVYGRPPLPADLLHPRAMNDQGVGHLVGAGPHRCKVYMTVLYMTSVL